MTEMVTADATHASRILDVVQRHLTGSALSAHNTSEVVARSWSRCINDYHLDPQRAARPPVLHGRELERRLQQASDLIECARLEMATLYQQLADQDCAVVLAGTDGVILHMVSTPSFSREVEPMGFCVGGIWSEEEAGTNGMGTCVAARAPVAVRQAEHFFPNYASLTCSAVPICDPNGEVVAVLDVTSRSPLLQQHSLVLLGMTAQQVENRLLDQRFRDGYPVRFHSRPEFVYTLHEGRLVVDARGRVCAANRSALMQLGFASLRDIRSRPLEDIFQTTLDDMLQRSARSSFHPVATYRAHVANRFFVVAQQPVSADESSRTGVATGAQHSPANARAGERSGPRTAPLDDSNTFTQHPGGSVGVPAEDALELGDATIADGFKRARRVIQRGIPVLMHGETGSGKEFVARAVHGASPNAAGSFVAVNCASLPETLIESELFGYRAGAFTGAQKTGRRGKILQAANGTLFLDEIGDMPMALQARLLRVLDERRVTPLGSEDSFPVEFQLISASHRDLPSMVEEGLFREDLYYRLNGLTIELPPLRNRRDKRSLMLKVLREESENQCQLSPAAEDFLMQYNWPGNMRQLRHVMRTLAALHDGAPIGVHDIPHGLLRGSPAHQPTALSGTPVRLGLEQETATRAQDVAASALSPFEAHERELMLRMLETHRWNISHVAKALGVSRNTVYRKLHKLHIDFGSNLPEEGLDTVSGGDIEL